MNENDSAASSRPPRYLEQGLTILPRPRFGPHQYSLQFPFLRPSRCANPCIIETAMIGNSAQCAPLAHEGRELQPPDGSGAAAGARPRPGRDASAYFLARLTE